LERPVLGRPSEEEALRMVVAFYCIMEPAKRAQLIKLAETIAMQSQVVEGCTHFSLLERDRLETIDDNEATQEVVPRRKPIAS
jgi:hypothetical protein